MIKKVLIIIFIILCANAALFAQKVSVYGGVYGSFMPSMGGNLDSDVQSRYLQSDSGIDGINRKMSGHSTSSIDRLTGVFGGVEIKAIFFEYFLARVGAEYGMDITGGSGKTVYNSGTYYDLTCEYSFKQYDMPLTIGLSIPFWHDARISISCGTAFAWAEYTNKFTSSIAEYKGKFSGWGFPFVFIIEGDYFIKQDMSLTSGIFYFNGRTRLLKDGTTSDGSVDYASIDFSGYRIMLGISYHFYSK